MTWDELVQRMEGPLCSVPMQTQLQVVTKEAPRLVVKRPTPAEPERFALRDSTGPSKTLRSKTRNGAEVGPRNTGTRRSPGSLDVRNEKWTIDMDVSSSASPASQGEGPTGVCSVCGRKLRSPESIARGMGPVCAARVGIV